MAVHEFVSWPNEVDTVAKSSNSNHHGYQPGQYDVPYPTEIPCMCPDTGRFCFAKQLRSIFWVRSTIETLWVFGFQWQPGLGVFFPWSSYMRVRACVYKKCKRCDFVGVQNVFSCNVFDVCLFRTKPPRHMYSKFTSARIQLFFVNAGLAYFRLFFVKGMSHILYFELKKFHLMAYTFEHGLSESDACF